MRRKKHTRIERNEERMNGGISKRWEESRKTIEKGRRRLNSTESEEFFKTEQKVENKQRN